MIRSNKSDSNGKYNYCNKVENPLSYEMEGSQLNEIEEEDHSEATGSVKPEKTKYKYLMPRMEDDNIEEEVRKNI